MSEKNDTMEFAEIKKNEKAEITEQVSTIKFGKPYRFEGQEYTEIDLGGMDKLTVKDVMDIQKQLMRDGEEAASTIMEVSTAFACAVAAKATELPIEFFKLMPRGTVRKVRAAVVKHINYDTEDGTTVALSKPYTYQGTEDESICGKTYTAVDFAGMAAMNALNESKAENRVAAQGFLTSSANTNYWYMCSMASMATGLPEDFFIKLPMAEILRIKNMVNDPDFLE